MIKIYYNSTDFNRPVTQDEIDSIGSTLFLDEIFSESFMLANTDYKSLIELIEDGGWKFEDLQKLENDFVFNGHVEIHTKFDNWEHMQGMAIKTATIKRINNI